MKKQRKGQFPLLVAALCYLASLFLGVFVLEEAGPSTFVLGFVCLFFGWTHVAWFANPLLAVAVVCHLACRFRLGLLFSAGALVLSLFTFRVSEVPVNEGGAKEAVVGYQAGFYLWMASIGLVLGSSLVNAIRAGSSPATTGQGPG